MSLNTCAAQLAVLEIGSYRGRCRTFLEYGPLRPVLPVPVIPIHATRRTCASLLVALDVHPRVATAVLRHSRIALTMEVYSVVSAQSTRDALRQLGGHLTTS